jgi:hypothetical protein
MTDEGTTDVPSVGHTLSTVVVGLDQLIKRVDDRGMEILDDPGLIEFMTGGGGGGAADLDAR